MKFFLELFNWENPKLYHPESALSNWLIVFTLTFIGMQPVMNMLSTTVLSTEIQGYLAIDDTKAIWVGRIFLFMTSITPLFSNHFSLVEGFKRSLTVGLILFYVGVILSAFATTFLQMLATRVLSGIGGGIILSANLLYLGRHIREKIRKRALAIYGNVSFGLGISVGLLIGGCIGDTHHWRWSFYLSFFLAAPSIAFLLLFIPETKKIKRPPLDYLGIFSLIISIFSLLLLVSEVKEPWNTMGWSSPFIKTCWTVSAVFFLVFILSSLTNKNPLVHLAIFSHLRFCIGALGLIILGLLIFGVTLIQMGLLEKVFLYDRWTIGWFVSEVGFIYLLFGLIPAILINRVPLRIFILVGFTLIIISCFMTERTTIQSDMSQIGLIQAIHAIGVALLLGPLPVYALSVLPPNEVAKGASFLAFLRFIGASFGSAIIGMISSMRENFYSLRFGEQVVTNSARYQQYASNLNIHLSSNGSAPIEGKKQSTALIIEYIINQAKVSAFNDAVYLLGWIVTVFLVFIAILMIKRMIRDRNIDLLLEKIQG